jgi:nucleoside-diphosphate-sugar epimerase
MGGAGYLFTGENDADVMHNSAKINLNMVDACHKGRARRIFYSSSACMYPAYNPEDPDSPNCAEDSAYPAAPDSEYGWEKLFSERLIREKLGWAPSQPLSTRLEISYAWDLAVCIGDKPDYDENNPFFQRAECRWLIPEA